MRLYFVTANPKKYEEAKEILGEYAIEVEHFGYDYDEIQPRSIDESSLEEVLRHAVKELNSLEKRGELKTPYFVDDSGLFIEALHGFPGVYSSYVYKTIRNRGILKLMHGEENRKAKFICMLALKESKSEEVKMFKSVCRGSVAEEERGSFGFGYDPIFMPEHSSKTFAEDKYLKNKLSHRKKALESLAKYILR